MKSIKWCIINYPISDQDLCLDNVSHNITWLTNNPYLHRVIRQSIWSKNQYRTIWVGEVKLKGGGGWNGGTLIFDFFFRSGIWYFFFFVGLGGWIQVLIIYIQKIKVSWIMPEEAKKIYTNWSYDAQIMSSILAPLKCQ